MIASYKNFLLRIFRKPDAAQAAFILGIPLVPLTLGGFTLLGYMLYLAQDIPSLKQIENPEFSYASVAYTADGHELARYGHENRTWVPLDSISIHVRQALIATEDHRFYSHWGINLFRMTSAVSQSVLGKLGLPFDRQGGSTVTQQLARNLYNEQIGFEVSAERKLKEMVTAVRLEQRYAKDEIAEMYLNTVPFLYNAYGVEAAARTYFNKSSSDLDLLESATLIGMLKGPSRYNPVRNPERSKNRRNTVLQRMISEGWLDKDTYEVVRDSLTKTDLRRTADVTDSFAPYFAEQVRQWVEKWAKENDIDMYVSGLRIETTLDSRLQSAAQNSVTSTLNNLQAVVNCEWSSSSNTPLKYGTDIARYLTDPCHADPTNHWAYFWQRESKLLNDYIKGSARYERLVNGGKNERDALEELQQNTTFVDSLKSTKSRLETGFVAMDPTNGYIKVWIGGRDLSTDWNDHVGKTKRQPGSIFKPFVYAFAIESGYSPDYELQDSVFCHQNEFTGGENYCPGNFGSSSGEWVTLREGLAKSINTVTVQLMSEVNPINVVDLAEKMGIKSELEPVLALSLGTSDITLLESVNAYSTWANQGVRTDPVMVTRILDETGQVLYEYQPRQKVSISKETAIVTTDVLRGVINHGTGIRIRNGYKLYGYDFAGKTGTTQGGADGWFILMHPELVTGAWVGFNDRRMSFRSNYWGQGAHNALFVVGEFFSGIAENEDLMVNIDRTFPSPPPTRQDPDESDDDPSTGGW